MGFSLDPEEGPLTGALIRKDTRKRNREFLPPKSEGVFLFYSFTAMINVLLRVRLEWTWCTRRAHLECMVLRCKTFIYGARACSVSIQSCTKWTCATLTVLKITCRWRGRIYFIAFFFISESPLHCLSFVLFLITFLLAFTSFGLIIFNCPPSQPSLRARLYF